MMKLNKLILLLFCSQFLTNCANSDKKAYKLTKIGSYSFRKNYSGSENLKGNELESFMSRNPTQNSVVTDDFCKKLIKGNLIIENTLNLKMFKEIPNDFRYKYSSNLILNGNYKYSEDKNSPHIILTFKDDKRVILKDTLEFDFLPEISFSILDIDNDGQDEFCSILKEYVLNGDNYLLEIFKIEKIKN